MMNPQRLETPANGMNSKNFCTFQFSIFFFPNWHFQNISETFYFFGDNDVEEWKDLLDEYNQPPLNLPLHQSALSFGLAGPGSGVPFHFHGPGFAETIYGRKRWLVFLNPLFIHIYFSSHIYYLFFTGF